MTECLGENTVTDLVEALLAPARRVAVEAHAARCEPCRRLISELVRRSHEVAQGTPQAGLSTQGSFDPWFAEDRTGAIGIGPTGIEARGRDRTIAPGTRVGRYVVRDQLGSGAMGAVFAAYDPELDRAIALKLLHPGSTTQRARIRREARALARLSHPNVVAAYDVGEHDGDLFLAMELVDGMSLRAWVKPQRSTADVLDVFRQAGRGLAAAHAAGLVHRDFKPDNAVVGNDGRVRVVDFGLAAGPDGGTALVGTPAYMAPEQFEAGGADAASDQFAFCVALHEALFGDRPFAVNLVEDVARGLGNGPPKPREVPAFVLVALARGLEVQPANRHPSMDALLAELSRDPGKLRTRVVVGGAVVVASLIAGGLVMSGRAGPPLCQDSTTVFARVWSPAREADLHARFTAVSAPFGEDAWRAVERGIAGFGARWVAARTESCEATRVRGVQSDQIFSLRSLCLDHGLGELDALATLLESVDPASIAQAPAAIDRLPSLAECANLKALLAPVPLPVDKDAAAVAAVNQQLARGRALRDAARWAEARSLATTAVEVTRTIGHSPTHGAALFLRGEAEEGSGDARQAEASLREAFAAAEAGSDDLLAARAAAELVFVVGQMQNRTANGLDWAFHADTALKRAGGDLEIEARIAGNRATLRAAQDNFAEARVLYQRALDLRIKTTGPTSVTTARALFNLGYAVMAQGDNAHALELDTRALHLIEAALGPRHPDVATLLNAMGSIQNNQGKFADALGSIDRAISIARPALGSRHPDVGRFSLGRGLALTSLGRYDDALVALGEAISILDRDGGNRLLVSEALLGRGDAERGLRRDVDALASYQRALMMREADFGHDSEAVASVLESLGSLYSDGRRYADALVQFRAALAIREKVDVAGYFETAYALAGIGEAELHLGHARSAVAPLRKAVELLAGHDGDPPTLATMRFSLAAALWDAGEDKAEARALAAAAEAVLATAGPVHAQSLDQVRRWKRGH